MNKLTYFSRTKLRHFQEAISHVQIQGATAVAAATVDTLMDIIFSQPPPQNASDWRTLKALVNKLSRLRPTEPMARNLSHWLIFQLKKLTAKPNINPHRWSGMEEELKQELHYLLKEVEAKINHNGLRLVRSGQIIFTHCHSSLAESILINAYKQGKRFEVYHTETRPLFQGRITARHLSAAGVPVTMVADGAAAWLVSNHSGDQVKVSWVLLGADSIGRDGSVLNKIGSFSIALSAYDSGIPVYVATTLLKFDASQESRLEIRPSEELWPNKSAGIKIINYAFDCLPAKYISGLITEFGLIKPQQATSLVKHYYPWLFKSI